MRLPLATWPWPRLILSLGSGPSSLKKEGRVGWVRGKACAMATHTHRHPHHHLPSVMDKHSPPITHTHTHHMDTDPCTHTHHTDTHTTGHLVATTSPIFITALPSIM